MTNNTASNTATFARDADNRPINSTGGYVPTLEEIDNETWRDAYDEACHLIYNGEDGRGHCSNFYGDQDAYQTCQIAIYNALKDAGLANDVPEPVYNNPDGYDTEDLIAWRSALHAAVCGGSPSENSQSELIATRVMAYYLGLNEIYLDRRRAAEEREKEPATPSRRGRGR